MTLQPQIIAVISPNGAPFYAVKVEQLLYKFQNVIKAVDTAFKLHFVLNASYSYECSQTWTFVQKVFYKIQTKEDKPGSALREFMGDLN